LRVVGVVVTKIVIPSLLYYIQVYFLNSSLFSRFKFNNVFSSLF